MQGEYAEGVWIGVPISWTMEYDETDTDADDAETACDDDDDEDDKWADTNGR